MYGISLLFLSSSLLLANFPSFLDLELTDLKKHTCLNCINALQILSVCIKWDPCLFSSLILIITGVLPEASLLREGLSELTTLGKVPLASVSSVLSTLSFVTAIH